MREWEAFKLHIGRVMEATPCCFFFQQQSIATLQRRMHLKAEQGKRRNGWLERWVGWRRRA